MKTKLIILALLLLMGCSADLSEYEPLINPRVVEKPAQNMLVIEVVGDPNETADQAFGPLFKTYFKLKETRARDMSAPVARWPKPLETPKDEWLGIYALAVSEAVTELPEKTRREHPGLKLENWYGGLYGEILHKGSYASEPPTVEKLHQFLEANEYEIIGPHEEEYLKGPGVFTPGNQDKYYTIIRYPVAKKQKPETVVSDSVSTEVVEEP